MQLTNKALAFTGLMALVAVSAIAYALETTQPLHDYRFVALFALALATSRLKIKLPGLNGNMSVDLPFILIAITQLGMFDALLVALPACAAQCFPKRGGKPKAIQLIFNLSAMTVAVASASLMGNRFAPLGVLAFFIAQTLPVAAIISLTEGGAVRNIWSGIARYSFPFYVLSAGIATMVASAAPQLGWQTLLAVPVLFAIFRSYESYCKSPVLATASGD